MDGGISAVGSIFNASWRIATVVYELKAVGEQTRDLLDTTSQVSSTLQHCKVLRRQRSGLLNVTEKKWIDDVLQASDKAVGNVAALIEPARVDMQTQCNKIRFFTRGQFILRDSPKVQVQLGRLGIAAHSLNTAMGVLCNREGTAKSPGDGGVLKKVESLGVENELKPPPSYEVVELLDRRRESVLKRRASKLPLATNLDAEMNKVKPLEEDPHSLPMVDINVAEVQPTPVTSPQPNRYAEDDGLQVVDNYWGGNPDPHPRGPSPMDPYSRHSAISLSPDQYHQSTSSSYSPSTRELDLNTNYFPPPPPGPPPQQSWQQPQQPPMYQYPPPLAISTQNPDPYYNRPLPPDPPLPRPPYTTTNSQPQLQPPTMYKNNNYNPHNNPQHQHPHTYPSISNPSATSNLQPTSSYSNFYCRSPDTISLDPRGNPYSRPPSRSSIMTTEELSTVPRQKGRARGRAWLEHQSER
jgi:hypothetical protein